MHRTHLVNSQGADCKFYIQTLTAAAAWPTAVLFALFLLKILLLCPSLRSNSASEPFKMMWSKLFQSASEEQRIGLSRVSSPRSLLMRDSWTLELIARPQVLFLRFSCSSNTCATSSA